MPARCHETEADRLPSLAFSLDSFRSRFQALIVATKDNIAVRRVPALNNLNEEEQLCRRPLPRLLSLSEDSSSKEDQLETPSHVASAPDVADVEMPAVSPVAAAEADILKVGKPGGPRLGVALAKKLSSRQELDQAQDRCNTQRACAEARRSCAPVAPAVPAFTAADFQNPIPPTTQARLNADGMDEHHTAVSLSNSGGSSTLPPRSIDSGRKVSQDYDYSTTEEQAHG